MASIALRGPNELGSLETTMAYIHRLLLIATIGFFFFFLDLRACYSSSSESYTEIECDINEHPDNDDVTNNNHHNPPEETTCRLYLAQSSIPNSGMGMYSSIDIPKGSSIGNSDIMIPIFYPNPPDHPIRGILNHYLWDGRTFGAHFESPNVVAFAPGMLAAVNGHSGLKNVQVWTTTSDGAGLHRSVDPGAGAFTLFHDVTVAATVFIKAGMELFADYGDDYFSTRPDRYEDVPGIADYGEADDVVDWFEWLMDRYHDHDGANDEVLDRIWRLVRNEVVTSSSQRELLPESFRELKGVMESGGTARYNAHPDVVRSLEWLETNGRCVDNLRMGNSTVPQAGRGAFATRFLSKGSLIAPVPLIPITDKQDLVRSYRFKEQHNNNDDIASQQLLINYCFGHNRSTLLLCPYGPTTSLINHSSKRPNANITWSSWNNNNQHDQHLHMTIDELRHLDHTRLMFDLIATRDIVAGDEIFIDYGREWEDAWNDHVLQTKTTRSSSSSYTPASAWNENVQIPIRTQAEQITNPYPDNIELCCYYKLHDRKHINQGRKELIRDGWKHHHHMLEQLRPCQILQRETSPIEEGGQEKYTARITSPDRYYDPIYDVPPNEEYIINNIPREAIKFVDKPYTSDMHYQKAFRHAIMIPDEIFPAAWKNVPKEGTCEDRHENCSFWASVGECDNNPGYMHVECAVSCNTCKASVDNIDPDPRMAIRSYGVQQVLTEDVMDRALEILQETVEYMNGIGFDKMVSRRKVVERCRNEDTHCAVFAARGECERNAAYMNRYCAPCCKMCHLMVGE